ncbi:MAG: family 16 glycosylhydrolase [Bacteroidetes bacterium]|nr:family 16 glycosylhydrolase [Bacteroidota bacterium]
MKLRSIFTNRWGKTVPSLLLTGLLIFIVACNKEEDQPDFNPDFSYEFIDDNNVRFTNNSEGVYYSLIWNFGNGEGDTTTNKNKSYVIYYPVSGSFNVSLKLTNNFGTQKSTTKTVKIENNDLEVSFTVDVNPDEPNYVTLTNTTQGNWDSFKWIYRNLEVNDVLQHVAYFPYAGDYEIDLVVSINNQEYSKTESVIITQDDPNIATGLIWAEEFEYTGLPDPTKWNMETGGDGWGNEELQYYTDSENNASVDNGILTITAREESLGGRNYTSARITTQGKFDVQYGRIEARIKLPYGQGMWPAFWMLGANFSSVGWPQCGEIDIMEMVGGDNDGDNTTHSTIHWDNAGEHAVYGESYTLPNGILADDFHVYAIEWDDQSIKGFIDEIEYFVADITPPDLSEFHNNFFIILNLAVGGNWPGPPNASTDFPQTMQVDYVRVYQDQ